jgi:uncharacterized iron-regulated membrane protein
MYRNTRQFHKWAGVFLALFLVLIAATGVLLAMKDRLDWVRPTEHSGTGVESMAEVISIHDAIEVAIAQGDPNLTSFRDIDRVDFRPRRNVFKVLSREGYVEFQIDGSTGEVLQKAQRTDQFIEDLHDFSFFADWAHSWLLPVVGLGLFGLALTGIFMFGTPVVRRWQFKRKGGGVKK